MRFHFFTQNINKRLYKRAMRVFLYETLKKADARWNRILDDLNIYVYPSSESHKDPHFHGQNGVGGVTGMFSIKLYLEDKKTPDNDTFFRILRRNMIASSHELSHWILIALGKTHKVPLKYDDFGGHKAGTMLNFSTAEVHDRHTEKIFFWKEFWFLDWKFWNIRKLKMQCLDIRDLV